MKLLIKKLANTDFAINLRNLLNIKPVYYSVNGLKYVSVSDAFGWRTDNNFTTRFKYLDILNIFYKIKDSWIEIHFYSKNNKIIKIQKNYNLEISNEIEINSEYLDNIKDYGTFYIYHHTNNNIEEEAIIANRCYLGYSQNKNLPSFVHGNTYASFQKIFHNQKISTDIIKTSIIKNYDYKIQKYFDNCDKNELFFSNPTSKLIEFSIDQKEYSLHKGCCVLIDVSNKKIINIKSNCLFLRPTVFSYKDNYLDVYHS
jgi:hypothetical protein